MNSQNNFEFLKLKSLSLPSQPGVYLMKNNMNKIIYVGKAKRLKSRVSQYFSSSERHSERILNMIAQINDFEYILTQNEFEALVLECNLIKIHSPKYNILLKDDKGFNYIKVINQKWPMLCFSRKKEDDNAEYIGPYMSGIQTKKIIDEAKKLYKIPLCNRNFSEHITKPCLYYFINRCSAPCARKIDNSQYRQDIKNCVNFIKNGSKKTLNHLNSLMEEASKNLEFEKAAAIRDKIKAIKKIDTNQNLVSINNSEQDFFAFYTNKKQISIAIFCFRKKNLFDVKKKLIDFYEDIVKVRTEFIKNYYNFSDFIPEFITINGKIENSKLISRWLSEKSLKNIRITQPKQEFEKKIMKTCEKNAKNYLLDTINNLKTEENSKNNIDVLKKLSNILNLQIFPETIEAYDISNIGNTNNVAGVITIKNGNFMKSAYKKFKIKNVNVANDYSSIKETLERRFKNLSKNFQKRPDLILIDGGKGQVSSAKQALSELKINIPTFGMTKNSKHRTECLSTENRKISIKKCPEIFNFIENIQNEVHRFAITFHRKLRLKNMTNSELLNIPEIGKKRAANLLKHFGNIKKISKLTINELKSVSGMNYSAASNVFNYFNKH